MGRINQGLLERRVEMMSMLSMGMGLHKTVLELSRKYTVTTQALYIDHKKMHEWGAYVAGLQERARSMHFYSTCGISISTSMVSGSLLCRVLINATTKTIIPNIIITPPAPS